MNFPKGHPEFAIYRCWVSMRYRCNNPVGRNACYKGVKYDNRWERFENFYEDMRSGWAPNLSIDRIDSTKGYSKNNCRWITMREQQRNKSSNIWVNIDGVTKLLVDWCKELGIKYTTAYMRIYKYNWPIEKALMKVGK